MEEFVYVLLAGVAIFLIAGLLVGIPPLGGQEEIKTQTLFEEDFGSIGKVNTTFRRIRMNDFSVGVTRSNRTVEEVEEVEIKNGFFGENSRTIKFDAENPKSAYLSFEVYDTNLYGDLKVIVNGEEDVSSKMMTGITPNLKLENVKKGKNTVKIKAEGPGLRFWAPNLYILKDLELKVNDYGHHSFSKVFNVFEYELRGFSHGEFKFFVDEARRNSNLDLKVNGRKIYSQKPLRRPLPYRVRFQANNTDLNLGENTFKFSTGENSEYHIDNPRLNLFYFGNPERTTIQREFRVFKPVCEDLGKEDVRGVITFESKVYIPNKLEVYLENKTFSFYPESGKNKLFFDQEDIKEDENEIRLETEGSFEIKNFKIETRENEE